jgi:hypothetical protein
MSIEETEAASAAVAVKPNNRVSLADIEANIMFEETMSASGCLDHLFPDPPREATDALFYMTICFIVLRNGFTVIGKSAPVDPANYNEALGRKFAREDAIRQIWPLMGYAKRQELAGA